MRKKGSHGKSLCTKGEHKFTFGIINPNVSVPFFCEQATNHNYTGKAKAQFKNKLIIETLSVHYAFVTAKKKLPNFEVGILEVALALATAAVSNYGKSTMPVVTVLN